MTAVDIALCLSGGGFRAALFHLGSLRRLNELGILSRIDSISAVSGGSMLAGLLASHIRDGERRGVPWPRPGQRWEAFDEMARELHLKVSKAIPLATLVSRDEVFFRNLPKGLKAWIGPGRLSELPERPRFIFNAAELRTGQVWTFAKDRVGSPRFGYSASHGHMTLAEAVAASACFPAFDQLRARVRSAEFLGATEDDRPGECEILFADGGIVDNLGLTSVAGASTLLVSDGGRNAAPLAAGEAPPSPQPAASSLSTAATSQWDALRWIASAGSRDPRIHGRLLAQIADHLAEAGTAGAYWAIGDDSRIDRNGQSIGYSGDVARTLIATVRTQLDAFSAGERQVLENHGYLITERQSGQRLGHLVSERAPASAPWPDALEESFVRRALRNSSNISSGIRAAKRWLSGG